MFDFRRCVAVGVAVVLGLSGCGGSSDGVSPSPSVSWEERNTPDIVTIAVPDGWEVLTPGEIPGISRLVLVSDREPRGQEGISIGNFSPKIVGMHGPDVDVKYRRDYGVEHGTAQENLVGRGIPLEPRLIAGVRRGGMLRRRLLVRRTPIPFSGGFCGGRTGCGRFRLLVSRIPL